MIFCKLLYWFIPYKVQFKYYLASFKATFVILGQLLYYCVLQTNGTYGATPTQFTVYVLIEILLC